MAKIQSRNPKEMKPLEAKMPLRVTITIEGQTIEFPTYPSSLIMVDDDSMSPDAVMAALDDEFNVRTIGGLIMFCFEAECLPEGLTGSIEIVENHEE